MREFKVGANVGKPQVAYKEAIKNSVKVEGNSSGNQAAADSMARLDYNGPLERGTGFEFVNKVVAALSEGIRPAVEKASRKQWRAAYLPDILLWT